LRECARRARSDAGKSDKFDLEHEARAGGDLSGGDAFQNDPSDPAASVVFQSQDAIGQLVILDNIIPELARNGFEVEPFGPRTIAIKTAPGILKPNVVEKLLLELLDGLERETQVMNIDALKRRIAASVSCHAAIKINMPLEEKKMRWLVDELMKTDVPTVCPHGRPIILRYDLREIEKAFKRA